MLEIMQGEARSRMNLILLGLFLAILLFFGGASRADVLAQAVVRIAAIVLIAVSLPQLNRESWRAIKLPVLFLLTVAGVIAVQLIPLPPGLWASLPGRALFVQGLELAGIDPVWRPLSLTPDLTLNSLLAVLPPLAAALALGTIERSDRRLLLPMIVAGVIVSALIGLLQISSGSLYLYQVTNEGSPVGVFANRNHQALFLAAVLPILAAWAALPHRDPSYRRMRKWIALCAAAPILPILMVTGSRAGLVAGVLAVILALAIPIRDRRPFSASRGAPRLQQRLWAALPIVVGLAAVGAAYWLSRDVALGRLFDNEADGVRDTLQPLFVQMAWDFFPFGAGFGAFDTVFRVYEPATNLGLQYLNHAHNDVSQVVFEGGLLALLLMLAFLLWFVLQAWRSWAAPLDSTDRLLGRAGSAVTLLILVGSAVDYPLRTPLLAVLIVIACHWMHGGFDQKSRETD